jgi:integrase
MAVEKRKYANRTTYRAYWRNPYTQKTERGPARDSLREARKDDAEIKIKLEFEPAFFLPDDYPDPSKGYTIGQLFSMYYVKKDLTPSTQKSTHGHYTSAAKYIEHMGHADMSMIHRHYQHVVNEQRRKAVEQFRIY